MEYTYADVKQATLLLVKTNGRESAVDLLACYGVEHAFKLRPEDWGNYIDDAHRLIEYGAQIVPRGVPVEDKPRPTIKLPYKADHIDEEALRKAIADLPLTKPADHGEGCGASCDPSAIRDQKGSKQAKAWAVRQHLEEISLREAAAKHRVPNVHAPLSALYICSNLEPRGYPR
jgi:hypothetical protein